LKAPSGCALAGGLLPYTISVHSTMESTPKAGSCSI
jgi:hypothetical protein